VGDDHTGFPTLGAGLLGFGLGQPGAFDDGRRVFGENALHMWR
jgi:hypothetical protein